MKQHITKEQWDELSPKEKNKFKISQIDFDQKYLQNKDATVIARTHYYSPNIGQMIEFLGDGWVLMLRNSFGEKVILNTISNDLLCSFLWNAVKHKIK